MVSTNKKFIVLGLFAAIIAWSSCASLPRTSASNKNIAVSHHHSRLADSILAIGLDHEALYTLASDIKPMSSLIGFTLPFEIDSLEYIKGHAVDLEDKAEYVDQIKQYTAALKSMNFDDLSFIMVPFRAKSDSTRAFQINVIRKSRMSQVINDHLDFFSYMGIVPETDPGIVLSTIENHEQILRLRAYGYLFGYPDYAVDFFVEAYYENQKTGEFVERDFFQIPVYSRKTGHFVYAMPKNHIPTATDSTLYQRSTEVLERYKKERPKYLNADSSLLASQLIRKLYN